MIVVGHRHREDGADRSVGCGTRCPSRNGRSRWAPARPAAAPIEPTRSPRVSTGSSRSMSTCPAARRGPEALMWGLLHLQRKIDRMSALPPDRLGSAWSPGWPALSEAGEAREAPAPAPAHARSRSRRGEGLRQGRRPGEGRRRRRQGCRGGRAGRRQAERRGQDQPTRPEQAGLGEGPRRSRVEDASDPLTAALKEELGDAIESARSFAGDLTFQVRRDAIAGWPPPEGAARVHLPRRRLRRRLPEAAEPRFDVVYHLYSFEANRRIRLKVADRRGDAGAHGLPASGASPTGPSARSTTCTASASRGIRT